MTLSILELLQGVFSLIFVLISIIIVTNILIKFIKYKIHTLFLVGFALIGLSNPWLPDAVNLLLISQIINL